MKTLPIRLRLLLGAAVLLTGCFEKSGTYGPDPGEAILALTAHGWETEHPDGPGTIKETWSFRPIGNGRTELLRTHGDGSEERSETFFLWEYVGPNYNVLYIAAENLRSCYWAVEELTHGTLTVRKSFIGPDLVTSGDYSERIRFSAVR